MRKVAIIGTGWVGSSVAISTLHTGIADELLLNDIKNEIAEGEAMDLAHGELFYAPTIVRTATIDEIAEADVIVIAVGRGGKPGETRLDLLRENAKIIQEIGKKLKNCRGVIIVVTNPVDVMTRLMQATTGLPPEKVIGTGTMLDTARLRQIMGRELKIDPRSIDAQVVGEHGDSEVILWSSAQIGGVPLISIKSTSSFLERIADQSLRRHIAEEMRTAAYEIIKRKGATNHAIGLVTAHLLGAVLRNENRVLTVSRVQTGACGIHNTALSLPAIVNSEGAVIVLEPSMNDTERQLLMNSSAILQKAFETI